MAHPEGASPKGLVGAVLSRRYRLTKHLGDGGMGQVYAAETLDGGQRLAIKLLHPEFRAEAQVLARFLEEATTSKRLVHPNIVRVYESGEAEDGSPYIVMELLEGVPLGAYTKNGGRVPMAQAVPILQGILAGLAAAHAQGIIHRDLKPDNVFLVRDAHGQFVVKVLDFGIAKVMDVAGGMGNKTRTGMLLGTPAYMSPEQIKSARDVDARADLWSAGVMFYEMLTGKTAFPAPTEYARLASVLSTTPEPMTKVDPGLAPLASFMDKSLQKDRALRHASALEMARALTAAVSGAEAAALSRQGATPLSRLPEVPVLFAPSVPPNAVNAPAEPTKPAPRYPTPDPRGAAVNTPGNTLASPSGRRVSEPPPQVVLAGPSAAAPFGETLPSNELSMFRPSQTGAAPGVRPVLVVLLVAGAFIAGLLLGFGVGRSL